jgi:hypothetical protein
LSFAAVAHFVEQHIKAVSDGGSTGHIMSLETAKELISSGVIPEMLPIRPGTMSIVFGKEEATEPVIGEVITTGVLDRVLVVNNIAITLISETSLTKRGVIFLKNDTTLIGLLDSRIVVMGRRDPNAKEGSVDQLWNIDLRSLFRQPGFDNKEGVSVLTKKVGDGGQGGVNLNITPAQKQGKNSSFNGVIALGGGAEAGGGGVGNSQGTIGGSGGGGSSYQYDAGYAGTDGQGFAGGNGARGARFHGNGGGGEGATEKGQDSNITPDAAGSYATSYGGKGGDGIKIDSINLAGYNTTSYFGGGGGGVDD